MSRTHTILMIAGCVLGMGTVAAIFLFNVPVNNVLIGLLLLICPLSHILMMRFMGHGGHAHSQHQKQNESLNRANLDQRPYYDRE